MGIFGQSSPFDADVEKATSETNTNENWSLILDVCDKVSSNPRHAKDCLKAILKRMGHTDPHIVMQAITLLDACVSNCGKPFHLEIASREFQNEFRRLLSKAQPQVSLKMRQVLKNWAENDFRTDPELNLIYALYTKLRLEGLDFSNLNDKPTKPSAKAAPPKDPNVVSSQQEEDDIAKAIELSLKESKSSPRHQPTGGSGGNATAPSSNTAYPSLYPSFGGGTTGSAVASNSSSPAAAGTNSQQQEPRKVRALYDFEAAEENELTFFSGEIIHVLDDSDPNWWKGYNQRGEGLFPSNFVSADLSVDPKRLDINQQQQKNGQFDDDAGENGQKTDASAADGANQRIEIDEAKIDRLLHLLHEANPEDPTQDSEEMLRLEQEVHQMGPLIDAELERVDRKHAQLTQLSSDLVDAINLYHSLMRDDRTAMMGSAMSGAAGGGAAFMSGMVPGMHMPGAMASASLGYQNSMPNPQMLYGAANYCGNSSGGNFPPQIPQQSYGVSSLPYGGNPGVTGMPPTTHNSPMTAAGAGGNVNAVYGQIPMQFQNGHVNSPQQINGVGALPVQQLNSSLAAGGLPQQQQQSSQPQANATNFQMLPQHLQQQQSQQSYPQSSLAGATMSMGAAVSNEQQQQQQFMSPQHQQQQLPYMPHQQPQFAGIPNGQHHQMAYNNMPTSTTADPAAAAMLQQLPTQMLAQQTAVANNRTSMDQLQQQMAAMPIGVGGPGPGLGMNQPIMQNFLTQNEPKQNIPIYQQQR